MATLYINLDYFLTYTGKVRDNFASKTRSLAQRAAPSSRAQRRQLSDLTAPSHCSRVRELLLEGMCERMIDMTRSLHSHAVQFGFVHGSYCDTLWGGRASRRHFTVQGLSKNSHPGRCWL